jgi:hypothetical protein
MIADEAKAAMAFVAAKAGNGFGRAFLENRLTEFFLYGGWLQRDGRLRTIYDFTQPHCAQIWGHSADEAGVVKAVMQASAPGACPFLAVHRVALREMAVIPRVIVAEFWRERSLFSSVANAVRFTLAPNAMVP